VIVSKDLLKKVGLGLVALLVVFNTYSVHKMKRGSQRSRAALSGLRARMVEAPQRRGPVLGQRQGGEARRGSKGSGEGKGHWKGSKEEKKQQKTEAE